MKSPAIDHVLYATANLEQGMDEIESLLGVRPVPAGHHPKYGTHNALLSLEDGIYLEVIARDPGLPEPAVGSFVEFLPGSPSRLITWVSRTNNIHDDRKSANLAGASLGEVWAGSRKNSDGVEVSWQATDPYAMPLGGAVPFLIDWGETTHPSEIFPSAGSLKQLLVEHPQPELVQQILDTLGVTVTVRRAGEFRLAATIETENGPVVLS